MWRLNLYLALRHVLQLLTPLSFGHISIPLRHILTSNHLWYLHLYIICIPNISSSIHSLYLLRCTFLWSMITCPLIPWRYLLLKTSSILAAFQFARGSGWLKSSLWVTWNNSATVTSSLWLRHLFNQDVGCLNGLTDWHRVIWVWLLLFSWTLLSRFGCAYGNTAFKYGWDDLVVGLGAL